MVQQFQIGFFPPLCLGHQPDRSGKLGHCHPFSLCIPVCKEAWERGHSSVTEEPDQKPCAEDRYGQQDEKDGRVTAVSGERPKEQKSHRKPGTINSCEYFLPLLKLQQKSEFECKLRWW